MAKAVVTAASTAFAALLEDLDADPRAERVLRHHHAVGRGQFFVREHGAAKLHRTLGTGVGTLCGEERLDPSARVAQRDPAHVTL
jgi:hypothetical protein